MTELDTTPEAAEMQREILRSFSLEERLKLTLRHIDNMHALLRAGIRDRHPEFTPRQVFLASARTLLGEQLFREAFAHEADTIP